MKTSMKSALTFVTTMLAAAAAFAKETEAAGGHHEPHISNMWGVGSQYADTPALGLLTVTFAVFAGGLLWIIKPRMANLLEERSYNVKKAIEEAQRARAAAEARALDAENRLASLGDETKRLRADFEIQGKAEMARIEKMAEETAVRIAKDAEDTIVAETERARQLLRAEASKLALELAEERIRAALSADDDTRLQKALIAGLDAGIKAQPRA